LLDFEYGAFRHALYDLTAWDVLCPLPRDLLTAMRRRYRAGLGPAFPTSSPEFRAAWGEMVAFRALALLSWIPARVLDTNAPWVGDWTAREAILVALSRLSRALAGEGALAPIRRTAGHLESRLRARWAGDGALPQGDHVPRWPVLSPAAAPAPA
jgi:hypothetical protein